MYPMTDPRRKSLRGAPWDGPSLTCYKKRSPNMGTKTTTFPLGVGNCFAHKKRSPNMGTKTNGEIPSIFTTFPLIKKDPQTWGRKLRVTLLFF